MSDDDFQRCGRCNHQFRSHAEVEDKRCLVWGCDCPAFGATCHCEEPEPSGTLNGGVEVCLGCGWFL